MYSVAIEDYLKSLWKLGPKDVGTQELASYLEIKPASVTKMVLRLTEMGLVNHTPYKGASLTRKGELEALSVVRRLMVQRRWCGLSRREASLFVGGESMDRSRRCVAITWRNRECHAS